MDLHQEIISVVIGLGILLGALNCFFGYQLFKILLRIIGFVVGGTIAGFIGYSLFQDAVFAFLTGILGGFIGAALSVALYFIGVFISGAFFGGILGAFLYAITQSTPELAVILILATISGILAVIFEKLMIIVSTAFSGSFLVVIGTAYFTVEAFKLSNMEQLLISGSSLAYAMLLCWLTLGIFGVIFQYRPEAKLEPKPFSASALGRN